MEHDQRLCLSCGKTLRGRLDKKFCDDNCRNAYNNIQNSDKNNFVRSVNNILRKNRRILEELLPTNERTISVLRQKLLEKGYDFTHFTNQLITQKGTYCFCYEYGYLLKDGEWILLVKRKEGN